jgi:hypothetical protein
MKGRDGESMFGAIDQKWGRSRLIPPFPISNQTMGDFRMQRRHFISLAPAALAAPWARAQGNWPSQQIRWVPIRPVAAPTRWRA